MFQSEGREIYSGSVSKCSRCGGDHEEVTFTQFINPVVDDDGTIWDWWAICPTNGDPILMLFVEEEE